MASVFLSYDHEDAARAAPIAAALEAQGHSVWWDRHIHGGAEYNSAIETAVDSSNAVVVLWSSNSIRSAWVRDEAAEGRDAGKLVPVLIDAVKPPMGFRQYQTIDLAGWKGGKRIPRLPELLHAIDTVAQRAQTGSTAAPAPVPERPPPPRPRPLAIPPPGEHRVSRRLLVGGGAAAAAAALAGGGIYWSTRDRVDPRFQALMDKGDDAVRNQTADQATVRLLEQAVAMQPGNPKAWGLLALVKSLLVHDAGPKNAPRIVEQAEQTARRALSLDPKEPNALLSM
ncbi:MAG: toll/interleukin-1 receptor domain-containing protein, partial [Sphingomicrobium sp.]